MHPDIAASLRRNGGLVDRRTLLLAGLPPEAVDRRVRRGELVAVRRGVYAKPETVAAATIWEDAQRLRDRATTMKMSVPFVLSHTSSALALGLPILSPGDRVTHVTRPGVVGSHTRPYAKHHLAPYSDEQVVFADGQLSLDAVRTALDIAREYGSLAGLVAADSALRMGHHVEELEAAAAAMRFWPYKTVVDEVVARCDTGTDSVLETLARDLVEELGYGRPETQFGLTANGTAVWCDLRLGRHIFEADGFVKLMPVAQGGLARDSMEVLRLEKERQDFVSGFKLGVSRIVNADIWGAGRKIALKRLDREYRDTCQRFGTEISDLAAYRPRTPRLRANPTRALSPA